MYAFLRNNREELIARCKTAVALRPRRVATELQLGNGVPLFLEQLTRTLEAEEAADSAALSERISGLAGGDSALSEIGVSATAHGRELMQLGYSVDQVVHDYGDLCQAITSLAVERDVPFTIDEFRTLNRCLDNAIADAVTEFSAERDLLVERRHNEIVTERIGFVVHELRNAVHTATLALAALDSGNLPVGGATGGVLKRSLATMTSLLADAVSTVRMAAQAELSRPQISVASVIGEAAGSSALDAAARGCTMVVRPVDPALWVCAQREPLVAAIVNLLQNGFKFTRPHTAVELNAHASEDGSIFIDVSDHCGGLPEGFAAEMFRPFTQGHDNRSGLGLGLAIARRSVEGEGGTLRVRDVPGTGCVFTIVFPPPLHRRS